MPSGRPGKARPRVYSGHFPTSFTHDMQSVLLLQQHGRQARCLSYRHGFCGARGQQTPPPDPKALALVRPPPRPRLFSLSPARPSCGCPYLVEQRRVGHDHAQVHVDRRGQAALKHEVPKAQRSHAVQFADQRLHRAQVENPALRCFQRMRNSERKGGEEDRGARDRRGTRGSFYVEIKLFYNCYLKI